MLKILYITTLEKEDLTANQTIFLSVVTTYVAVKNFFTIPLLIL